MKTATILKLSTAALIFGGTTVGCTAGQGRIASASTASAAQAIKQAEAAAGKASAALARKKPADAVAYAEAAVTLRPQDASYRALLGKAYLAAGRFASARQALADALSLDPGQPGVALNLALAETASGDYAGAKQTLEANSATIPAADRGLALALAGDPAGGVAVLTEAARAPDADAKTRQNLALALALAGRWAEAHTMAKVDLAPADADARIMQWAAFARPTTAADQVATLLGVTPVADQGQPVALALVAQAGPAIETAATETEAPLDSFMPGAPAETATMAGDPVVAPVAVAGGPGPSVGEIVFAERREIVQSLPAAPQRMARAERPVAAPAAAAATGAMPGKGNFYVQLGAFASPAVARDAWARVRAKHPVLAIHSPSGMPIKGVYRLSVGGFARGDADALCGQVRAGGGVCFVRAGAGDTVASWARGRQVAAR